MHRFGLELLEAQANSLNIPLEKVFIPSDCSNCVYESEMERILTKYQAKGVSRVVFGDILLEDLRKYREDNLQRIGMEGIFPLWKRNTDELARKFIKAGFRAIVTCVDTRMLDKDYVGRNYDERFLNDLPHDVDPCGENGEFHTFVFDGPPFKERVMFKQGKTVLKDGGFYFCNLEML